MALETVVSYGKGFFHEEVDTSGDTYYVNMQPHS